MFLSEHCLDSKICRLTWMEDSNKQKWIQFFGCNLTRYPLTLALPHLITKAIVFSAIIQCIQGFLHWNISYSRHVQIFDPFNKICIITITNFTNNKSICYNSQKVPSLAHTWLRLKESCASIVQQFIYTVMKKYRHNTSA